MDKKFGREEYGGAQARRIQGLGELVHCILWTFYKVLLCPRKEICSLWPPEQIIATLGHGSMSRPIAQSYLEKMKCRQKKL